MVEAAYIRALQANLRQIQKNQQLTAGERAIQVLEALLAVRRAWPSPFQGEVTQIFTTGKFKNAPRFQNLSCARAAQFPRQKPGKVPTRAGADPAKTTARTRSP